MKQRRPKRRLDAAERLFNWYLDKPAWLPFALAPVTVAVVTLATWFAHQPVLLALISGLVGGYFVLTAGQAALVQRFERRQLIAFEHRLSRLRRLSWEELENVVAEVYRAEGFHVVETGQSGPDGGVDLVLTRGIKKTFVQCKQMPGWLDVRPVREFYGVICLEKADAGIIVTTGRFTAGARDCAKRAGIQLMTGDQLEQKVRDLIVTADREAVAWNIMSPLSDGVVVCPLCRSDMRWAGGSQPAWTCTRAPACKGLVRLRYRESQMHTQ